VSQKDTLFFSYSSYYLLLESLFPSLFELLSLDFDDDPLLGAAAFDSRFTDEEALAGASFLWGDEVLAALFDLSAEDVLDTVDLLSGADDRETVSFLSGDAERVLASPDFEVDVRTSVVRPS